nr:glycosyltransferase family 2 protein [Ignavibacteria bacterium]
QRKFALTKVSTEWIISLDADERCSSELKEEIRQLISRDSISENGFFIPRENYFLGKKIRHCGWYPDLQMRLFRKQNAFVSNRLIHESYEVKGETGKLQNHIIHYTANSVSEYTEKINHYSSLSAIEKVNKRKIGLMYLLVKPKLEFLKKYIFQLGFLDGTEGLMISLFHMTTKSLTYMKIYELQNKKK